MMIESFFLIVPDLIGLFVLLALFYFTAKVQDSLFTRFTAGDIDTLDCSKTLDSSKTAERIGLLNEIKNTISKHTFFFRPEPRITSSVLYQTPTGPHHKRTEKNPGLPNKIKLYKDKKSLPYSPSIHSDSSNHNVRKTVTIDHSGWYEIILKTEQLTLSQISLLGALIEGKLKEFTLYDSTSCISSATYVPGSSL